MSKLKYPVQQWIIIRAALGIYLAYYFVTLIPYTKELFTNQGIIVHQSFNFTYNLFPNILAYSNNPTILAMILSVLTIISLCFAGGLLQRPLALILWYGWACLYNLNNLIEQPSMGFLGWLILAAVVIPPASIKNPDRKWFMPQTIYWGAWIILGISYSFSRLLKLTVPGWLEGVALPSILQMPITREFTLLLIPLVPPVLFKILAYIGTFLQITAAPAFLFSLTRKYYWGIFTLGFILVLIFFQLNTIIFAMLIFHAFVVDITWFTKPKKKFLKYFQHNITNEKRKNNKR